MRQKRFSAEELLSLASDMHSFRFEQDLLEQVVERNASDSLNESDLDWVSAARSESLLSYEQFMKRLRCL